MCSIKEQEINSVLTIGLFPNTNKSNVTPILDRIVAYLKERQVRVLLADDVAEVTNYHELAFKREQIKNEINLAVSLGGDGTLLQTVREVAPAGVPVCGINLGQLGFLTEIEIADLDQALDRLILGNYTLQERLMLDAVLVRDNRETYLSSALNDVVVTKGGCSRMIRLKLYIDGELTAKYPADGLILSTSTGSTGYSLSAGGPIVSPGLNVIVVTPICPHALHARSMVVSENEELRLAINAAHDDIILTIDGQNVFNLLPSDEILIRRSATCAKFIRISSEGYFHRLRLKLWRNDDEN
ncbi:MAG: ppnK [Firmicutes bacterium]|nr:ppnK [Bacillota bacterium]